MAVTVVDDLRRATSEINEIQTVLENKGKITPGTTVPFEDYSDLIDDIGDDINLHGTFTVVGTDLVVSST